MSIAENIAGDVADLVERNRGEFHDDAHKFAFEAEVRDIVESHLVPKGHPVLDNFFPRLGEGCGAGRCACGGCP